MDRAGHVLAKPPARRLAADLGIDLSTVTGTGPQGR
ncbi:E3 binding domain-containing protein [Cutibacterium acnes]